MAGRPPKPTHLLVMTGAARKNPKRMRARENEPKPTGPLGEPPARFMIQHPDTGYQDAEKLRALWGELAEMAPWLTSADRWTAETICDLKLLERKRIIKPAERRELSSLCNKCGLDPSGRVKVNTFPSAPKAAGAADPRDEYMRKKQARAG